MLWSFEERNNGDIGEMLNCEEKYSDRDILNLIKGSHEESEKGFRILFDKYAKRLNAYCVKVMRDRTLAEDVFQETFYRFFQHVRADIETCSIMGFLITIARNLCLNYKRDHKKEDCLLSIDEIDIPLTVEQDELRDENIELVKMAIDMLESDYKEPLILKVYGNMHYHEIACVCGISENNARSRVFRAKQKIRVILSPYLKETEP